MRIPPASGHLSTHMPFFDAVLINFCQDNSLFCSFIVFDNEVYFVHLYAIRSVWFFSIRKAVVYQRLPLPVRAHPWHNWTAARGHTLFTDTFRRESTHVLNGSGLGECAHVKSLYERSIVVRIMNRYVQCSSHLFSYPATGAVTCVHTQLRATVTRTMPSIDPSSMESKRSAKSLHVCTTELRHFAV